MYRSWPFGTERATHAGDPCRLQESQGEGAVQEERGCARGAVYVELLQCGCNGLSSTSGLPKWYASEQTIKVFTHLITHKGWGKGHDIATTRV